MFERSLAVCAFMIGACAVSPAAALSLEAQLFPLTGEVRFRNAGASAVPLGFYSIVSPSGRLNGTDGVWRSIDDAYDASGNGFIDNGEWVELSAVATQLTEGALDVDGGSLPGGRSISLGHIWNPTQVPDLSFDVREPNSTPITITILLTLAGDYFVDGVVDQQDFLTWRQAFGSTTSLSADGNLNGVVDAADYVVWRDNFGNSLAAASSGSGLTAGAAVPEPGMVSVLIGALGALACVRRRVARRASATAACGDAHGPSTRASTSRWICANTSDSGSPVTAR